jgi:phosphate starvation-inducible PhoH-like protein
MYIFGFGITMILYTTVSNGFHSQIRPNICKLTRTMASKKKNIPSPTLPIYLPKTENQKKYVSLLEDPSVYVLVSHGPAGCGKTLFACSHAVKELISGNTKRIVLTRPTVCVEDEELGFLPGTLDSKMSPYTRPLFDILHEYYSNTAVKEMIASSVIEIAPLAFMRGRTFKNTIIIADEMQNATPNQIKMLSTRIGENSKLLITGDLAQSDLGTKNGLYDIIEKIKFSNFPSVQIATLTNTDVLRSKATKTMLKIYDGERVSSLSKLQISKNMYGVNDEYYR